MRTAGRLGPNLLILLIAFALACSALALAGNARALSGYPADEDIVQGALLYDSWYAALDVQPPAGDMPIWSRQTTNTRSGPVTWRCSECHGWDYRGVNGAYGSGSHYTGFPDVMALAAELPAEEIVAHLKGSKDPAHDFSPYLDNASLAQLADFLKYGTIDDRQYIDPVSLEVIDGNLDHGRQLYASTCATCHGEDGEKIVFRGEGLDEFLGTVAARDPWRFLHRTRFGTAGTSMPVGYTLGWAPADGRDILAYAQTLPAGVESIPPQPAGESITPGRQPGGPAANLWTGILTALGSTLGIFLGAVLFILVLLAVGAMVVTVLRRRR
jgi:thiosulfate dehydrogenase